MKKKVLISTLGLTLLSTMFLGTVVQAADYTTSGEVSFTNKDDGTETEIDPKKPVTLVKPGTSEEKITVHGSQGTWTNGAIRFAYIPSLKFGTVKISSQTENYEALPLTYNEGAEFDDSKEKNYIPPFVQVIDERGSEKPFTVTATATAFTKDKKATDDLKNSRMVIKSSKLTNNILDKTAVDTDATKILGSFTTEKITLNESASPIMNSKDGKATDVSASTVVFDKDYASTKTYTKDKLSSIELNVPTGEKAKDGTNYEATITWSLDDTK